MKTIESLETEHAGIGSIRKIGYYVTTIVYIIQEVAFCDVSQILLNSFDDLISRILTI